MPQVDFESLVSVCGGGDRKIGCADGEAPPEKTALSGCDDPPDSICLPKGAEFFDWYDRNAVYQRKGSTKGNSNPKSKPSSTSIIGLPRPQKPCFSDAASIFRRNPHPISVPRPPAAAAASSRLFRNRSVPWQPRSAFPVTSEPSSPNVSCIGRVRSSKKDRRRHWSPEPPKHKAAGQGFWATVAAFFLSAGCRDLSDDAPAQERRRALRRRSPSPSPSPPRRSGAIDFPEAAVKVAPGLGAAKRFASGRRSGSEAADLGLPDHPAAAAAQRLREVRDPLGDGAH